MANGCIGENAAHEFVAMDGTLSPENQKRLGRNDIVGWSWCKRCGGVLEIFAGAGEPPRITLPVYTEQK